MVYFLCTGWILQCLYTYSVRFNFEIDDISKKNLNQEKNKINIQNFFRLSLWVRAIPLMQSSYYPPSPLLLFLLPPFSSCTVFLLPPFPSSTVPTTPLPLFYCSYYPLPLFYSYYPPPPFLLFFKQTNCSFHVICWSSTRFFNTQRSEEFSQIKIF